MSNKEMTEPTTQALIDKLRTTSMPISDIAPAIHKAADAIEALEATNSANMATCKGIIQGLQAERDALQAQLAAAQGQEPIGFVESAVRGAGGFHACLSSGVFVPAGIQLYAAPLPQQVAEPSVPEGWKQAVALAYGHLWHVNNEPMAPIPLRSSETAAYEARKQLRDLLTHEERGLAINQVQAILAAAPQPKE